MRMKHFLQKLQISYVNEIVWEKQCTVTQKALIEDWHVMKKRSTLGKLDEMAVKYGLPKVSENKLDKKSGQKVQ